MRLERGEVVLSRPGLVGEHDRLRMPQLADRRHVLPDPGVVQELSGRRVDRGVDVHPEEDGPAREVEVVHREEIPGHSSVTERPNVIVFLPRVQARGTGSGESGSDTPTPVQEINSRPWP